MQQLESGERKTLLTGGSDARYLPTGHLVYALGGTLFAVPFDIDRLEVRGGPVPVVEGVRRVINPGVNAGSAQFGVSDSGFLVYLVGPPGSVGPDGRGLVLADRQGNMERLKLPPGAYHHPRVSPDGRRVTFETSGDSNEVIVWIYDLAGTTAMRRLTFGGNNRFPIWSADGERIAFQSDREGDPGIFWQRADGAGAAERLTKADEGTAHVPESWSPDGKRLLYSLAKGSTHSLWVFPLEDKKASPFGAVSSTNPITAAFSPDGRWVAYYSNAAGSDAVYVEPFPPTGAKYQIAKSAAAQVDHHPLWSRDGKELFYIPNVGELAAVKVMTQPGFSLSNPEPVPRRFTEASSQTNIRNYDVTPDGKIIGLVLPADPNQATNVAVGTTAEFRVVLNWTEELKRLVPTN